VSSEEYTVFTRSIVTCRYFTHTKAGEKIIGRKTDLGAVAQLVEALRHKPMGSLGFFIDFVLPTALWSWGRLSFLMEMRNRKVSWG
jgi:hypothetical protein